MSSMNLRHLQYLRLIVEQGSFEAAARAAGVTQPTISHGMRQLQKHFDSPLLERAGRRLVPTGLAHQVASEGSALAERLATAGTSQPLRAGELRVGLTPSAALVCGPALHAGWCQGHARRSLALSGGDEGSLLTRLRRGELDLVIAPRPRGYDAAGLACDTLYRIQPLACARRAHPLAGARSLAELRGAAWACVRPNVSGPVDVLTEAFAVRQMPAPRVTVSCPDYTSMLHLMAHGDLLAVLPHPAQLATEAGRQIVTLRLRETLPLYEVLVFRAARARAPVERLVQRLLEPRAIAPVELGAARPSAAADSDSVTLAESPIRRSRP